MKGVIIAAGFGSRLWNLSNKTPKTLLPYGNGTILSTIIGQLKAAGVTELGLVLGFNMQEICAYLETFDAGMPIKIIENLEWERGNGISVHKAKDFCAGDSFILSMSDHVVHIEALRQIVQSPLKANLLLVDPYIEQNFDLDDATKVQLEGNDIVAIGKELKSYNALDCGIFRLQEDFFGAVETAEAKGIESISGAISELISAKRMQGVMVTAPYMWLDIDTPEAYNYALENIAALSL